MLTAQDLHGIMAMMPAFATSDAADINARNTVDVDNLKTGVDRIIRDGIDVISTAGSFGEFHTLLDDEWQTLARATIEAVDRRVPLFIGCTALNSRAVVERMRFARDAGAEGVLIGVPFYFPSSVDNAVRFFHDVADLFPDLGIMIYHNPPLHRVTLPVAAFKRLTEKRNIIGMKDSHRDTVQFMKLQQIIRGKITQFVNTMQYHPYASLGAPGFWSFDCWMGPWPVLALREAIARGDTAAAEEITLDLTSTSIAGGTPAGLDWRETAAKIAIANAGYVDPGPLRPPFVEIPANVQSNAEAYAAHWLRLCEKYRPRVGAAALAMA
jgi:dihydrodipicolinate synthase/N-acetylneuraminate lyase